MGVHRLYALASLIQDSTELDVPMSGKVPVLTTDCELGDASSLKSASGCAKEIRHWRPHWEDSTAHAEAPSIARQSLHCHMTK